MGLTNIEKLNRFYQVFAGSDHVLVIINADPDAIASAMAIKRMLWRRVTNVTISNINTIIRPDNMAMIRLLDVTLIHISKIEPDRCTKIITVDSQPAHHESFADFNYAAIIDHHPDHGHPAEFRDIRPDYGATATILTEYLRAAKITPTAKLATGLFYAIKSDTSNFERNATNADIRAFQFLFKHANIHLARRMEQVDLRIDFLDYFKKAIEGHIMTGNRIFSNLGNIRNPDICVLIADFFMRVNTVTWSIVSGLYENKLIIIVRNDGIQKNAGQFLDRRFGSLGTAGGHESMARAELPVENLKDLVDYRQEDQLLNWIISQFDSK